jgi:hypothetical protein
VYYFLKGQKYVNRESSIVNPAWVTKSGRIT